MKLKQTETSSNEHKSSRNRMSMKLEDAHLEKDAGSRSGHLPQTDGEDTGPERSNCDDGGLFTKEEESCAA